VVRDVIISGLVRQGLGKIRKALFGGGGISTLVSRCYPSVLTFPESKVTAERTPHSKDRYKMEVEMPNFYPACLVTFGHLQTQVRRQYCSATTVFQCLLYDHA
jgi:hypothetical protein